MTRWLVDAGFRLLTVAVIHDVNLETNSFRARLARELNEELYYENLGCRDTNISLLQDEEV